MSPEEVGEVRDVFKGISGGIYGRRLLSIYQAFLTKEDFLLGREPTEGESGYSISVTYDKKGKPVVQVKTYGDVDAAELRKDIKQRYPGAKIEGLEKKPLVRIVDEEEKAKAERKKKIN